MEATGMTVLADEMVRGHRVVTFHSIYTDKIMALTPYRTEVVKPGEILPSYGMDHASREDALRAHREKIEELSKG